MCVFAQIVRLYEIEYVCVCVGERGEVSVYVCVYVLEREGEARVFVFSQMFVSVCERVCSCVFVVKVFFPLFSIIATVALQ